MHRPMVPSEPRNNRQRWLDGRSGADDVLAPPFGHRPGDRWQRDVWRRSRRRQLAGTLEPHAAAKAVVQRLLGGFRRGGSFQSVAPCEPAFRFGVRTRWQRRGGRGRRQREADGGAHGKNGRLRCSDAGRRGRGGLAHPWPGGGRCWRDLDRGDRSTRLDRAEAQSKAGARENRGAPGQAGLLPFSVGEVRPPGVLRLQPEHF
mmetsp:Transcript_40010/g.110147  ORF Transcript_40010/g.110147 Transcript_40010/m.110147 type:complete len:203 (-) Transcript_40010:872-1480(-)